MNDPEESPDSKPETMPEGVPEPPAILPPPDKFGTDESEKKPKKKAKQRHPTDTYQPLKQRKRWGGRCCGCLGLITLLGLLTIAGLIYWQFGQILSYEKVHLEKAETLISEAPDKATLYYGEKIIYAAPPTEVEICIIAKEIQITGDFLENVSLVGLKVVAEKNARFAKNLDVKADEFIDKGITLKGKLTGRVQKSH